MFCQIVCPTFNIVCQAPDQSPLSICKATVIMPMITSKATLITVDITVQTVLTTATSAWKPCETIGDINLTAVSTICTIVSQAFLNIGTRGPIMDCA